MLADFISPQLLISSAPEEKNIIYHSLEWSYQVKSVVEFDSIVEWLDSWHIIGQI